MGRLQNEKWQAGEGRSAKVPPPPPSPLIGLLAVPMKGAGVGAEMDLLPPPVPWPSSLALLPQLTPKKRRA